MLVAAGVVSLLVGLVGFGGQLTSIVDWPLAQKLGLQESDEHTEPLFRRLEKNTAMWDVFSWWTLPVAGILMLLESAWWPVAAIFAGGVYLDTAGRELAKLRALDREGVETGTERDRRTRVGFFIVTAAVALWVAGLGVFEVLQ